MKKPNITEGKWVSKKPDGLMTNLVMVDDVIIVVGGTDEESQAISAVPEMIDALIEVYTFVDGEYLSSAGYKKVRDALKKAGVDFSVQLQEDKKSNRRN